MLEPANHSPVRVWPNWTLWHSSHTGRKTGENTWGLSFALPSTHRSGPGRLSWWRVDFLWMDVGWNSSLNTRRRTPLRDYAKKPLSDFWTWHPSKQPVHFIYNLRCLGHRDEQKTNLPLHMRANSALRSENLPLFIETAYRSSFSTHRLRKFQAHWLGQFASATGRTFRTGTVLKALAASTSSTRTRDETLPPFPAGIQHEIAWRTW